MVARPFAFGLISAAILVVFAFAAPSVVQSHGGGMQFNKREFAGPYEVALGTAPDPLIVGDVRVSVVVIELSTRTVVLNANITVTARGPDARMPDIGPVQARADPTAPSFYDLNTTVDRKGAWTFTLAVSAEPGDGTAEFVLDVGESSPVSGLITFVAVLTIVAAIGIALRMFLKEQDRGRRVKRRRRRPA